MVRVVVCGASPVGGDPESDRRLLTTAVALARLGRDVRVAGATGAPAAALRDRLAGHGVGWIAEELPDAPGPGAGRDWVHVTALATPDDADALALAAWVEAVGNPLSIDVALPADRPDAEASWAVAEQWFAACERGVLRLGRAALNLWAGPAGLPEGLERQLAEIFRRYGVGRTVVTLGPDGAVARDVHGGVFTAPGRRVRVADTVGAGETFTAGLLAGLTENPADLPAALALGVAASALVCQRVGANPPTRDELESAAGVQAQE